MNDSIFRVLVLIFLFKKYIVICCDVVYNFPPLFKKIKDTIWIVRRDYKDRCGFNYFIRIQYWGIWRTDPDQFEWCHFYSPECSLNRLTSTGSAYRHVVLLEPIRLVLEHKEQPNTPVEWLLEGKRTQGLITSYRGWTRCRRC